MITDYGLGSITARRGYKLERTKVFNAVRMIVNVVDWCSHMDMSTDWFGY